MRATAAALILLALCAASARHAVAADDAPPPKPQASLSGYERIRRFGGPDSVQSSLRHHDAKKDSFYRGHAIKDAIEPYYRWKRCLKKRYGLSLGMDYNLLYQGATASLGDGEAAGGVWRFYGHWKVFGRDAPTTGEVVFRIENRHRLATDLAPSELGADLGSLYKTANSFDSWGWGMTNLQWQQWFADGRYGVAVGVVDLRDWVDTFDLSNWRTALLSAAVTYPTNPLPAAGLGGAVFACFRKCNTPYLLAGFSDANGHPSDWRWDTFFDAQEYYAFVEAGWTPSFERKAHDNLRITYWHQDATSVKGKPEGWGVSFSAAWMFGERFAPFLRGGYAEGGLAPSEAGIVAGLGIHRNSHDLFGVAFGWGRPHEAGLRDQKTVEVFYRLQISQNVGITPDLQVIVDPSRHPGEDVISVFSLRLQLAF